jgi:hypothetical protein
MKRFYAEVGMPLLYFQHRLIAKFPNKLFAYRLIAFISTYSSALTIYLIATHFGFLNEDQALILSLLYLSYTGYHMNIDTIVGVQYTLPTAIFYFACYITFFAFSQFGYIAFALHVTGMVLFSFSFNANSLLVYYFGFVGLIIWRQIGGELSHLLSVDLFFKSIICALPPVAFWALKEKLTPRHGRYANYNRIDFSLHRLVIGYVRLMRYGLEAAIVLPIRFIFSNGFAWLPIILGLSIYFTIKVLFGELRLELSGATSLNIFFFGLILLLLAGLPYILVGQPINDQGWATKNSMLLHLPFSMIVFGLLTTLTSDSKVLTAMLIFFILACGFYIIRSYLYYLAVYVKDRSWLSKLKNVPGIEEFSIFQVIDDHWLKSDLRNRNQDYPPVCLYYMFDRLWSGQPTFFGMREFVPRGPYTEDEVLVAIEGTTISYDMVNINRSGRQARVTIKGGETKSSFRIALLYLRARVFNKQPSRMDNLLATVTNVEFCPLA